MAGYDYLNRSLEKKMFPVNVEAYNTPNVSVLRSTHRERTDVEHMRADWIRGRVVEVVHCGA